MFNFKLETIVTIVTDLPGYAEVLERVRMAFSAMPRGARSRAAHDMRVSQSAISSVLTGTLRNRVVLQKLSDWVMGQTAPTT